MLSSLMQDFFNNYDLFNISIIKIYYIIFIILKTNKDYYNN